MASPRLIKLFLLSVAILSAATLVRGQENDTNVVKEIEGSEPTEGSGEGPGEKEGTSAEGAGSDEDEDPLTRSLHWEGWVEEQLEEAHQKDSLSLLLAVGLMVLVVLTIWIFKMKRCRVMHETGFSLVYGKSQVHAVSVTR